MYTSGAFLLLLSIYWSANKIEWLNIMDHIIDRSSLLTIPRSQCVASLLLAARDCAICQSATATGDNEKMYV